MSDPRDHQSDFYKALNEARLVDARAAVQAGLSINGLATTAILALLASAAMKGDAPHIAHGHTSHAFVWSLGFFGAGVFLAALAASFSYLANHAYAEVASPFRTLTPVDQARLQIRASIFHGLAYGSCFGSLAAFIGGVTAAVIGFDKIG